MSSEPSASTQDLIVEARRLETEAAGAGEETDAGRDLRARAALRVQALGERIYSVLICQGCFALTGWLSANQQCDACQRRTLLDAAYSDPHGGWVVPVDASPVSKQPAQPAAPLLSKLPGLRHPVAAHKQALVEAWMVHIRPDETGPIEPEEGYAVEVAKRDELEAADGSGMVIRFRPVTHHFQDGGWVALETTRIPRREMTVPPEFPAALPAEQLVEAWGDYKAAVDAYNCAVWANESERRETQLQEGAAHKDAIHEQRDVIELLSEA